MANYDSTHTGATIDSAVSQVTDSTTDLNIDSNTLVVDKSANSVGIGIAAPASALHIAGTMQVGADGSGQDVIFYSDTAGDNLTWDASEEKLTITGTDGQTALDIADGNLVVADNVDIEGDIDVNGTANLDNTDIDGTFTQDAGAVVFNEAGADYDFRVEGSGQANALFVQGSDGFVGIGTAAPTANLHQTFSASSTYAASFNNTSATGWGVFIKGGADNADPVLNVQDKDAASLLYVRGDGNVGIGTASPADELHIEASVPALRLVDTGNSATAQLGYSDGNGFFLRLPDDANNEDVMIRSYGDSYFSGGNVGIGTSSPRQELDVAGNIMVDDGIYIGTHNGDYSIDDSSEGGGSATLYIGNQSITTSSDIRIKENIANTEVDALSKISDLRVVDFNWNDPSDTSFNNRNARGKWTGLIAQEVIEHIPYVVNAVRDEDTLEPIADAKSEDGTDRLWGMEYDKLVPLLIKAIQELSAKVEALENA